MIKKQRTGHARCRLVGGEQHSIGAMSLAGVVLASLCSWSCASADGTPDMGESGGTSAALGGAGGRSSGGSGTTVGGSGVAGAGTGGLAGMGVGGVAGHGAAGGTLPQGGAGAGGNGTSGGGAGGNATGGTPTGLAGAAGAMPTGGSANAGGAGDGGAGGRGGAGGYGGGAGAMSGGRGGMAGAGGAPTPAPPVGKKFVGNIDSRNQVRSDFANFWNQFSPENAGKWQSIERSRDTMNWASLDAMHDYAVQHNVIFKEHTLVWGAQQPSWLTGLSQTEQRDEVEEWIRSFCERYPDVPIMDVVNEPPPHTTPPYVAALGGSGSSGYDWIAQAFKWAHQYCPNTILLLNDYNNVEYEADNARTIDIVKKILAAGAPINAVGAQSHDAYRMSTSTVQGYIDKIKSQTGLPVYVTEYDIDIADDNQQKSVMQSQFTMFWNNDNVKGITIWGYISGQTWKSNTGLMSSSGTKRPAMTWLMDFLNIKN